MRISRRLGCVIAVSAALAAPAAASTAAPRSVSAPTRSVATSDGGAAWASAPAQPPAASPFPLPIGYVGDIEFWQPNRGLLITQGNADVPEGLFAYDGRTWHQLSTVCGGTDGRIAWAGPDEFWTIADQRPGQVLPSGGNGALQDVSLCHFLNGQVVASYAMPLDQPNSYKPMNAAACVSPSDCWFGGALDSSGGAFHLHWDGSTLSVVDAPQGHEVASMTIDNGQIFESVQLSSTDGYGNEDPSHPPLVHLIAPWDTTDPFHNLFPDDTQDPTCGDFCPPLPEYGTDSNGLSVAPVTLAGLALSSDWRAGASDPQLWAAAGPDGASPPKGEGTAHAVVLRYADGAWTQVVPNLVSLPGNDVPLDRQGATPSAESVAAEPGQSAAWVAVVNSVSPDNEAHVDRIAVSGSGATVTDSVALGTPQGVGPRGPASAIACPAAHDCWLATQQGWLFHLTDGTVLPQDTDPNFAGVISFRPPDDGVPATIPDQESVPVGPAPPPTVTTPQPPPRRQTKRAKPIVTHMSKSRLVHGTYLELSFTLTTRAPVQLIARRHGKIVAETRLRVLRPGRHTLALHLNVHAWPTSLSLRAGKKRGHSGGGGSSGGGGGVLIT